MTGSVQLRRYLNERDAGKTLEEACFWSGLSIAEARLTDLARERGDLVNVEPLGPPPAGHNNPQKEDSMSVASEELRTLIERVERLEEEKKAIQDDIKDIYSEAKALGYDARTMRECVKLRKMEAHVRREREALLDTYKAALGIDYSETPLGRSAMERVVDEVNKGALGEGVTATFHPAH